MHLLVDGRGFFLPSPASALPLPCPSPASALCLCPLFLLRRASDTPLVTPLWPDSRNMGHNPDDETLKGWILYYYQQQAAAGAQQQQAAEQEGQVEPGEGDLSVLSVEGE